MTDAQLSQTRGALLDAAQTLYEAGGLDAMSFRSLAAAHGCSYSMPYSYFASKADLVDGLRVRAYDWLRDVLSVAASGADDPLAALHAVAVAYVDAGATRPRMYELLYSTDGLMAETDAKLIAAKQSAIGVCRGVISAAAEAGAIQLSTDADTAAHLFWAAAHGLVSLEHGGFLVVGRSIDDLLPVLLQTIIHGLSTPPQS